MTKLRLKRAWKRFIGRLIICKSDRDINRSYRRWEISRNRPVRRPYLVEPPDKDPYEITVQARNSTELLKKGQWLRRHELDYPDINEAIKAMNKAFP